MKKDKRGKCIVCGCRTRHQDTEGKWLCISCDMGLEDKLDVNEETILSTVKKSGLTPNELKILLTSKKPDVSSKTYDHSTGYKGRIGIIADTHIGHSKFDEGLFKYAGEVFRKEKVKNVYHAGDILEGMSGRDGHIFELSHIGFSNQIKYTAELIEKYFKGLMMYGIIGNHDLWYKIRNNGGINVGEELEKRCSNFKYLGENEADIELAPKVIMKLFHANDGSAYATSYKLQKLVESMEGGKKPKILVEGHYHKAMFMFLRNVHCLEAGTLCGQTGWMRGKKIAAHKGFWILEYEADKQGTIKKFIPKFYPAYD
jgi:predicted phosphodiesterase